MSLYMDAKLMKKNRTVLLFLLLGVLSIFSSCSNLKKEERKSYEKMHDLVSIFEEIETKEDVIGHSIQLKRAFLELVDLIDEFKNEKKEVSHPILDKESDKLLFHMKRVYEIEGAKELIEEYQKMALLKLDRISNE